VTLPCPPRRHTATPNKGPGFPGPLSFWGGKSGPSVPLWAVWDRFSNCTHRSPGCADPARVAPLYVDGSGWASAIPIVTTQVGAAEPPRAGSRVRCWSQSVVAIESWSTRYIPPMAASTATASVLNSGELAWADYADQHAVSRDPARVTLVPESLHRAARAASASFGKVPVTLPESSSLPSRTYAPLSGRRPRPEPLSATCKGSCRLLDHHRSRSSERGDSTAWEPCQVTRPGSPMSQVVRSGKCWSSGRVGLTSAIPCDPARVSTSTHGGLAMT